MTLSAKRPLERNRWCCAKQAQIQALEPILIVMMLGVIGGVALLFWVGFSNTQAKTNTIAAGQAEAAGVLSRIMTLPELSCARSETVDTGCIDELKAQAFAGIMRDPQKRLAYSPLLGYTRINLTWFDTSDVGAGAVPNGVILYDNLDPNATSVKTDYAYFTVYDPVRDARSFAMLAVEREG